MKSFCRSIAGVAAVLVLAGPSLGATLTALSSFGGGDGWLAPAEATFLQGAAVQRGMTYNAANNHVYVVDRNGGTFVRILDGNTGALLGNLDTSTVVTGSAGGTFNLSQIDVDANGVIYAANLSTANTSNFKVYRWATESSVPTLAFDGLTNRVRTGDSFAVTGSGTSTQFVAAGGSTAGQNYALLSTVDGLNYTASNPVVTGAATGAFRLGIDFAGPNVVLGKQSSSPLTSVATTGGAASTNATISAGEAPLAWSTAGTYLATVDVNNSSVRLYDGSNLALLSTTGLMDTKTNITGASVANGNGVGDLKFGTFGGQLRLYALNANNGIQAFTVTVIPEPATFALLAMGVCGLIAARRVRD